MVYISSWQEFQEAAEALYEKSPNKVGVFVSISPFQVLTIESDSVLREMEGFRAEVRAEDHR